MSAICTARSASVTVSSEDSPLNVGRIRDAAPIGLVEPRAEEKSVYGHRWRLVLAGGDGTRLLPLTRLIYGEDRPKQFCAFFGAQKSLLGLTLDRTAGCAPLNRTLVSLTRGHSAYYSRETALPASQRIVQPSSKGTAPPIVHGVASLAELDADAVVAILPSDHYYSDDAAFSRSLELAFQGAERWTDSLILLGARAETPDSGYGWIELVEAPESGEDFHHVRRFWEKPPLEMAMRLMRQNAAWNTFVMVGHVRAFRQVIRETMEPLERQVLRAPLWRGEEIHIDERVYRHISPLCFSRHVLSAAPGRLRVLRVNGVGWSDLGDTQRVIHCLFSVMSQGGVLHAPLPAKGAGSEEVRHFWAVRRSAN